MYILSAFDFKKIIQKKGIEQVINNLFDRLSKDFIRWEDFSKVARIADYQENGVIEQMPISDGKHYACKTITCYPDNPKQNKLSVIGFGYLADCQTGYPLLYMDMTLLTAFRTACTSTLFLDSVIKDKSIDLGIIGLGAQSAFHLHAINARFKIRRLLCYDIDKKAQQDFVNIATDLGLPVQAVDCIETLCRESQVIVTLTAFKAKQDLINPAWLNSPKVIVAVGGDAPGKTELSQTLLERSTMVAEYLPQTAIEGELQQVMPDKKNAHDIVELWKVISKKNEIDSTKHACLVFDSVGFALEDFSALKMVYDWLKADQTQQSLSMLPVLKQPKKLFAWMVDEN
jgi:ornithine cyclodeaminase